MRKTPSIRVEIGRIDEYFRAKNILNKGKHPSFIGRDTVFRCATNGGLLFFFVDEQDAAVACVNTRRGVLLVLNVLPKYRRAGVGEFALNYIRPNFIRAIESAVPYFELRGYLRIGEYKQGIKFRTAVLVRQGLPELAGRLRQILQPQLQPNQSLLDKYPQHSQERAKRKL